MHRPTLWIGFRPHKTLEVATYIDEPVQQYVFEVIQAHATFKQNEKHESVKKGEMDSKEKHVLHKSL